MQYFKSTKKFRYEAQNTAKVHILKDETHWLCGLNRKPNFEEVAFSETLALCVNCQVAAGMKHNDRQETFKGFIIRQVTDCIVDLDSDHILSGLELACTKIQENLSAYRALCRLEIKSHFVNETIGFIVIEANARSYSIRFTYKRNRKVKMHFESASRHYLTLPVHYVFGPESEKNAHF
jgi:hypothetical protein